MKWKLYELVGDRVINNTTYISDIKESNMVLNEDWCDVYSFENSFNTPEEAEIAFKQLCKDSEGKQHTKSYTFMTMVCLPTFMFNTFDIEE